MGGRESLVGVWLGSVPDPESYRSLPISTLEAAVTRLVETARAAWPDVAVEGAAFVAHVARKLPAGDGPEQALAQARAADLYISLACVSGDAQAIAALDRRAIAPLAGVLRRTSRSAQSIDDALQNLRAKLFVEGRIAEYTGRGSLEAWLRVAATRTLLHLLEKHQHERPSEDPQVEDALLEKVDPELEYVKARYRADFHAAFRGALAGLSADERNVLRLHVIDGLNIAEIGALRHVHRATVARWIADMRAKILAGTRVELARRLQVAVEDLDSVLGLLCSQLDRSLHRFLVATPG
jgi:RNA polymerase sigma-70 factor (ECF subfamily)